MISIFKKLNIINITIAVRSVLICCAFVIISKVITLSSLYSATKQEDSEANERTDESPDIPEEHDEPNIFLDDKGLTLKLDFMNLTPQDTKVLESLFNYREKLRKKASEIIKKEDQLQIIEGRIHQQVADLRKIKKDIQNLLDQHSTQEQKKTNFVSENL